MILTISCSLICIFLLASCEDTPGSALPPEPPAPPPPEDTTYVVEGCSGTLPVLFINTDSRSVSDSQTVVVSRQSIEPGEKVPHGTVVRVTLTDTDTSTNGRY